MPNALVVDDEEDIGWLLTDALEKFGLEVDAVTTGEDARRLLESKAYKLCLVDLKLSTALTGIDVIRLIREHQPRAAVAAMTGYVDIGLKQEAEALGIREFLAKPDDLKSAVFAKKIEALLGNG